jgi:outer membrane biogenesis lipoprotein LolB
MKQIAKIASLLTLMLMFGCKSYKSVMAKGELDTKLSSRQIIKAHQKQDTKFKTLQSRVKVEYKQGDQSQSHSINLRMEKDKTIWISATLGIVRAKITPEKVSFYNKLDNTYFDGDFSLISDFLGTELNFNNVQNLLLGESLFNLKNDSYEAGTHETSYMLTPENQNTLFEIFFLLNPAHFKMDSQQLAQPVESRLLQIDYKDYQEVEKQILPKNIKVIALESDEQTTIEMEFKSVSLNNDLRFPFRIPSGFKEIVVK